MKITLEITGKLEERFNTHNKQYMAGTSDDVIAMHLLVTGLTTLEQRVKQTAKNKLIREAGKAALAARGEGGS